MTHQYHTLLVAIEDGVATLRMNRPDTMNAFEQQLRVDLLECLGRLVEDDRVRVLILTGTGKAFSAGGDLRELGDGMTFAKAKEYMEDVSRAIPALWHFSKPIIAAVNGAAFGAGFSIAMELVFTGKILRARDLLDMGVINAVVPEEELETYVSNLARGIAQGPPLALASAKKLLNRSLDLDLGEALRSENEMQALCLDSEDHREGVAAFYEKRAPRFKGK